MLLDILFNFDNECFNLFKHSHLIGTSVLCDGLLKLKLDDLYTEKLIICIIMLASN